MASFTPTPMKPRRTTSRSMPGYSTNLNRRFELEDVAFQRASAQQDPFSRFGIPQQEREDYNLNPSFKSVHGMPIEERIPELKPVVPESASDLLTLGRTQAVNLNRNIQSMIRSQNIQKRASPANLEARSNFIGNTLMQIKGLTNSKDVAEFAEFKSSTQQLFQQYRKYITGVQAGYPELQMLEPILPKATDPPSIYISKALSAFETMKGNDGTLLKALGQRGFRTRQLRESGLGINPDEIRQQAISGGINVGGGNPIPGAPGNKQSSIEDQIFQRYKGRNG